MSQLNRITTHCLPSRWWSGALLQAVTGAPLVWVQFIRGRHPVAAGGERLVSSTESSRRECQYLGTVYQVDNQDLQGCHTSGKNHLSLS